MGLWEVLALPVSFVGTGARYMKVMFWSSLALILPTFGEISRSVMMVYTLTMQFNVAFIVVVSRCVSCCVLNHSATLDLPSNIPNRRFSPQVQGTRLMHLIQMLSPLIPSTVLLQGSPLLA